MTNALQALMDRIQRFQLQTFPVQSVDSKLAHLQREVAELRAAPSDPTEWADCLILFLGAAALHGYIAGELIAAAHQKLTICEKRKWPATPDHEGVYHHIEEAPDTPKPTEAA